MRKAGNIGGDVLRVVPGIGRVVGFIFPALRKGDFEQLHGDVYWSSGSVDGHVDSKVAGRQNSFLVLDCSPSHVFWCGDEEVQLAVGDVVRFDEGVVHGVDGSGVLVVLVGNEPEGALDLDLVDLYTGRLHWLAGLGVLPCKRVILGVFHPGRR